MQTDCEWYAKAVMIFMNNRTLLMVDGQGMDIDTRKLSHANADGKNIQMKIQTSELGGRT
tara:strand:+ start:225 stop:404 length:180 start_codon:yes stop_codon:yes gene_type:complete